MEEVKRKNIIEASELPEGDKVYMKKDMFGWRIVYPSTNPDGSRNWVNTIVGGWRNFVTVLVLILFLLWIIWNTNSQIAEYKSYCEPISKDPVKFCQNLGYCDAVQDLVKKGGVVRFNPGDLNLTVNK